MRLQQRFKGQQLGVGALGVIQPLNRQHHADTFQLLAQHGDLLLTDLAVEHLLHTVNIQPDRVRAQADLTSVHLDARGHALQPHSAAVGQVARRTAGFLHHLQRRDTTHHVNKVLGLTGNMKADVVALQQTADDFAAPGQHVEYVRRREVGVMEEGDIQVRTQRSQKRRHHPQVVVVQPDYRALCCLSGRALGKQAIDLEKYRPVLFTEHGALPEGVQGRPERLLGEALIEHVDVFLGQRYPRGNQIGIALGIHLGVHLKAFAPARVMDRPSHPGALLITGKKAQQRWQNPVG